MTPPLYRACSIDGCERILYAKGMCGMHYQRMAKSGTTDPWVRPPGVLKHGTPEGYNRFGCRCDSCRSVATALRRRTRERYPERELDTRRSYEARSKDAIAARRRADRASNPDKYKQRSANYFRMNPDRRHLAKLRRRAAEAGADTRVITVKDWRQLCARYADRCAYCGESRPLTREHVIPLSRGGRNSIGNLLPACGPCNYSKGNRLLTEWRRFLRATDPRKADQRWPHS